MFQTADATTSASASLQHDASRAVGLAALTDLKEKGKKKKKRFKKRWRTTSMKTTNINFPANNSYPCLTLTTSSWTLSAF